MGIAFLYLDDTNDALFKGGVKGGGVKGCLPRLLIGELSLLLLVLGRVEDFSIGYGDEDDERVGDELLSLLGLVRGLLLGTGLSLWL